MKKHLILLLLIISLIFNFIFVLFNNFSYLINNEYIPVLTSSLNLENNVLINETANFLDDKNIRYKVKFFNANDENIIMIEVLNKDLPLESKEFKELIDYIDSIDS